MSWKAYISDVKTAITLTLNAVKTTKTLQSWIAVPAGIAVMLAACFGIDSLFKRFSVSFPASVACLVVLFLALLACEGLLGGHATRRLISVIDVPAGWCLQWINVFFTPGFVTLPLSPPIRVVEVFKIIAVFIIGFFVMMALAAYLTRGLQLALGSSKRGETQRAEELGENIDEIPLSEGRETPADYSRATSISQAASTAPLRLVEVSDERPPQSPPQLRLQDGQHTVRDYPRETVGQPNYPSQIPLPRPRAERWATRLTTNFDSCIFAILLIFVGLPVYYATGYAMPVHLTVNILCYFAALAIPLSWRQYLHPVLVSSLLTVLIIWPLAEIRGDGLHKTLQQYRTGTNYLRLWEDSAAPGKLPGAGDIFGTVLDASIVSLALPMFQYRRELRRHFLAIVIPNVLISIASLFAYPPICFAIGISASRSLAFPSRSLTLALATPATLNLGGDLNTVSALAIVSGIMGVLLGQRIMAWMRIPEDDYVTRGVALGANSSAIATALLLRTDPRAAALSSLSMSLFGTVTVLFTSIPPIAAMIRSLVGL